MQADQLQLLLNFVHINVVHCSILFTELCILLLLCIS